MRAIICDKCGTTQREGSYGATVELNRQYVGVPAEVNLCAACTEKFMRWMKGEPEDDGHYPKISF